MGYTKQTDNAKYMAYNSCRHDDAAAADPLPTHSLPMRTHSVLAHIDMVWQKLHNTDLAYVT